MATGERLTVTYSHPPSGPLKLDIYCFVPTVDPIDPSPNLDRLPFLVFLHPGHFFTGSRRDVPPWLVSLARSLGTPLLCPDYRLAPHAGPSHSYNDLENLWSFIQTDLPWIISCSGPGAEVESGTEPLEEDFSDLQRRGGIDLTRGVLVGLGSGGYLAALGGGNLSPPPIALVLGYPTLDFDIAQEVKGKHAESIPDHLRDVLREAKGADSSRAKSQVPDLPILLQRAPYAVNVQEVTGMDTKEKWVGKDESLRRAGIVEHLLATNQWGSLLRKASPDAQTAQEMLTSESRRNRPYPPTIAFHGLEDTRVPFASSERFIESIRRAEPIAAAVDALSHSASSTTSAQSDNTSNPVSFRSVETNVNQTSRYLFLGIQGPGAGHAFDALLPRLLSAGPYTKNSAKVMGDRYKAGMIHIEHFVRHWLEEGSAVIAAKSTERFAEPSSKVDREGNDLQQEVQTRGARVKIPRGGPRL